MEVYIAETLDWEIQKTNFFTFVEYYLSAGLISPEDRILKSFMNSLALNGIDSTVRGLVKDETSQERGETLEKAAKNLENSKNSEFDSDSMYISAEEIAPILRTDFLKTFEFYIKDICNLIIEGKIPKI